MTTPPPIGNEPPAVLDAARVIEYASFDAEISASRRGSAVVGGVAMDLGNVAGLVVVEDLATGGLVLLHCNADWETLAAAGCADVASARRLAESEFPGAGRLWREFRALTAEESAEIESTRRFLRELIAGEHDG